MEAEDVEAPPKRGEAAVGDALAAVLAQARLQDVELGAQLLDVRVSVGAEPLPDRRQPPPVRLLGVRLLGQVDVGHRGVRLDQRASTCPTPRRARARRARSRSRTSARRPLDRLATVAGPAFGFPSQVAADPRAEAERDAGQPRLPGGEQVAQPRPTGSPRGTRGPAGSRRRRGAAASAPRRSARGSSPPPPAAAHGRSRSAGVSRGSSSSSRQRRDPPVLLEDRPRQRLGGVRGQHELDANTCRGSARSRPRRHPPRRAAPAPRRATRAASRPRARSRAGGAPDGAARRCSRGGSRS